MDDEHVVSVMPREMRTVEPPLTIWRGRCVCGWQTVQYRVKELANGAAFDHVKERRTAATSAGPAGERGGA